jgi:GAF domain-containing protein
VDDAQLLEEFAQMSRRLAAIDGVPETMAAIVEVAVGVIPGCDHVSLSHLRDKQLRSASSNDQIGPILDAIQSDTDQGPCLDAIRKGGTFVADDLGTDPRWPVYGPRAIAETSVKSSFAIQLHDGARVAGALNLFADRPASFAPEPQRDATIALLAAHATPALSAAVRYENALAALETRDLIGQAKGVLMARSGVDSDSAFELLVRASQRMNVKLVEVARRMIDGTLNDDSSAS